jgi:ketosteroid isomerase-like protein
LITIAACGGSGEARGELSVDDVAALRAIAEGDASIVLARDWTRLTERFTPDAVRMPPGGPAIEGRDAIRRSLEGMPPLRAFDFRMIDVQGDGHFAYMRAAWSITLAPPGAAEVSDVGKILIVFEKQSDGSWLTVADAWNSDRPPGT